MRIARKQAFDHAQTFKTLDSFCSWVERDVSTPTGTGTKSIMLNTIVWVQNAIRWCYSQNIRGTCDLPCNADCQRRHCGMTHQLFLCFHKPCRHPGGPAQSDRTQCPDHSGLCRSFESAQGRSSCLQGHNP